MCVGKGMVRGKRQAVDSVFIKANASMDSLVEKEVLEDASAFVNELEENSEFKTTSTRKKLVEQHHAWKEEAYKGMPANSNSKQIDENGNLRRCLVYCHPKLPDKTPIIPEFIQCRIWICKSKRQHSIQTCAPFLLFSK